MPDLQEADFFRNGGSNFFNETHSPRFGLDSIFQFILTLRDFDKHYLVIVQVALVICGLFICNFAYMRSRNGLFSGTYPLINSHPWSFYMRINYMRVYFWSPYLSHITRAACSLFLCLKKIWWPKVTLIIIILYFPQKRSKSDWKIIISVLFCTTYTYICNALKISFLKCFSLVPFDSNFKI